MDVFIEQIIKKKFGTKDYLIFAGIIIVGLLLIAASMLFIPSFSLIILIAVCFGAYYLISSRNLEFEYSITNGDITIDKIINRRSRKRVISMDAHNVEKMGKYNPAEHQQKTYAARLIASVTDDGQDAWYFVGNDSKKGGNVLVVFSPNEKVLGAIKPFLQRQVAIDAFGRN
ncbi:DUF6106 family protein [Caproiciproducens sp. LBM24188]|nr:hypothetical protein [Oscillospiraceae bacterium]HHV31080.1 hypothetical protein [Clostridiales bacterium]